MKAKNFEKKFDKGLEVSKHSKAKKARWPNQEQKHVKDCESCMETLDILADPKAVKSLKRGEEDLRKGKTRSWQEIKASLEKL